MIVAKSVLFNTIVYIYIILSLIFLLPFLLMPNRYMQKAVIYFSKGFNSLLWLANIKLTVKGQENIPKSGRFIVACKHQSMWETLGLFAIFPNCVFILKIDLLYIPLFGFFVKKLNMITVNRGKGASVMIKLLKEARRRLKQNRTIIIFPEGTRTTPNQNTTYKKGIIALYKSLNTPCLPVALNSGLFWPRRKFLRHSGTIVVSILPAIENGLENDVFMDTLHNRIETEANILCSDKYKC